MHEHVIFNGISCKRQAAPVMELDDINDAVVNNTAPGNSNVIQFTIV